MSHHFRGWIDKMNRVNDGSRTLFESIAIPEVSKALEDWSRSTQDCVLIGGCAVGYYAKPRSTFDVDVLFLTDSDIPLSVDGFKKTRGHAFQHNKTHVEIELVTPELIHISRHLVQKVFDTARVSDGVRIASPQGLVALKLGRFSRQDQTDIETLMNIETVELDNWPLDPVSKERWNEVKTWSEKA